MHYPCISYNHAPRTSMHLVCHALSMHHVYPCSIMCIHASIVVDFHMITNTYSTDQPLGGKIQWGPTANQARFKAELAMI